MAPFERLGRGLGTDTLPRASGSHEVAELSRALRSLSIDFTQNSTTSAPATPDASVLASTFTKRFA